MTKEYDMEEVADWAVEESREFINTELQFVKKEHDFWHVLCGWHNIIGHLYERIPENMTHLHEFNGKISEKLDKISRLVRFGILKDLRIEKEDKEMLNKLKTDVKHRDWKVIKGSIKGVISKEKSIVRVKKEELKKLHSKFIDLVRLMKKSDLIKEIEKDLTTFKQKKKYESIEEYYFLQIYKFVRAYERIFRHLWKKELILSRKVKKDSKKIK